MPGGFESCPQCSELGMRSLDQMLVCLTHHGVLSPLTLGSLLSFTEAVEHHSNTVCIFFTASQQNCVVKMFGGGWVRKESTKLKFIEPSHAVSVILWSVSPLCTLFNQDQLKSFSRGHCTVSYQTEWCWLLTAWMWGPWGHWLCSPHGSHGTRPHRPHNQPGGLAYPQSGPTTKPMLFPVTAENTSKEGSHTAVELLLFSDVDTLMLFWKKVNRAVSFVFTFPLSKEQCFFAPFSYLSVSFSRLPWTSSTLVRSLQIACSDSFFLSLW